MIRRASRRDANEAEIVAALRARGAVVAQLPGNGLPDLLVGLGGRTKGRGRLTKEQVAWFAAWKGSPIHEVVSVDEALAVIGVTGQALTGRMATESRRRGA